jgi:DNA-binding response OmpR family regulator
MDNIDNKVAICIIEDNKPVRMLLGTLLKKSGFATQEFSDGTSALSWLKSNKPSGIIVDILLPDQNGTDVLNSIRNLSYGTTVAIIAVTGLAHDNDRANFLEMGFDAYFSKPVNTITFANDVKEVINEKLNLN